MSNYVDFINKLSLYLAILELEKLISYYKKACINNKEEAIINNLKMSLDENLNKYRSLLNDNCYENRDCLKKDILDSWEVLINRVSISDFYEKRSKDGKLIYAMTEELVSKDLDFSSIYLYLIEHNLYDPNMACGISSEPFYTMLPVNDLSLFRDANKKVITDKRTDFHILRNGTDAFQYACYFYNQATSDDLKYYWHCYLLWALKGNLSVLDSVRFQSIDKKISWEYEPVVYQIFSDESFNFLVDYLCSEEGILKQCKNSIYPCELQNKAVDFYLGKLEQRGIYNLRLANLKK